MKIFTRWILPALLVALALGVLFKATRPASFESSLDLDRFGRLPVQEGGRVKPLDTIARNTLLLISGKQSYADEEGTRISALEWFTELTLSPNASNERKVFRIDHPDIVGLLGEHNEERKYFSLRELAPHLQTLQEQFGLIDPEPARRTAYEKQLLKLSDALTVYDLAASSLIVPPLPSDVERAGMILRRLQELSVRAFPPTDGTTNWKPLGTIVLESFHEGEPDPLLRGYAQLSNAYQAGDVARFDATLEDLEATFAERLGDGSIAPINFEYHFNTFEPFSLAMAVYVLAFLAAALSWLGSEDRGRNLMWTGLGLLVLAFFAHTYGIWARMEIQDRPPVTNLYSSAIFVGWGAVLFCAILEIIFRNGMATAASALIAFPTLIIAHHLSRSGDTLEMMRAVLDSNFWLGTHVPTVTIGYSATFLGGAVAIIYLVRDRLFGGLDKGSAKALEAMLYGIVCFAVLFSFVGTVLGGIWADQSWGRFWGWDPKENGALMIVLWNALILHARWGKVASPTGLMQLAVLGNIITAWSWFGTNMLGVGLHSYGFMDSAFLWLCAFVVSQLGVVAIGWLPKGTTRSAES